MQSKVEILLKLQYRMYFFYHRMDPIKPDEEAHGTDETRNPDQETEYYEL
jgi:hypothetical protein